MLVQLFGITTNDVSNSASPSSRTFLEAVSHSADVIGEAELREQEAHQQAEEHQPKGSIRQSHWIKIPRAKHVRTVMSVITPPYWNCARSVLAR